jgi:hypothetical protein
MYWSDNLSFNKEEMNTSCPNITVETLDIALQPFPEDSFLKEPIERDAAGNMTRGQFTNLILNEITAKRLIEKNVYSAYQLGSRINREYCYYLKRVVFFDKKFAATGDESMKKKGESAKQKMDDLLASLNYMETFAKSGIQVTPTESQRPLSWKALGLTENFTSQRIEGMTDASGVHLRKDMLEYSQEKNRSATSLLALYGFLNLTAVGLLIYIYRSK